MVGFLSCGCQFSRLRTCILTDNPSLDTRVIAKSSFPSLLAQATHLGHRDRPQGIDDAERSLSANDQHCSQRVGRYRQRCVAKARHYDPLTSPWEQEVQSLGFVRKVLWLHHMGDFLQCD